LKYIEEKRASTKKKLHGNLEQPHTDRIGHIRMREFRTVDASKMLKAIANENDLTRTTLQHIKGVLSGIFTHAKNEGAFDGRSRAGRPNVGTPAITIECTFIFA